MLKLYCLLVQPHLSCCVKIWGSWQKFGFPIIKAQKDAKIFVYNGSYREHIYASIRGLIVLTCTDFMEKVKLLIFYALIFNYENIKCLFSGGVPLELTCR